MNNYPRGHYYVTATGADPQKEPPWVPIALIGAILGGGALIFWYWSESDKQQARQRERQRRLRSGVAYNQL